MFGNFKKKPKQRVKSELSEAPTLMLDKSFEPDLPQERTKRRESKTVQSEGAEPPEGMPVVMSGMSTHIGTREYQQDSAYVKDYAYKGEDAYAVLCDGMGGMADGGMASATVVEHFVKILDAVPTEEQDIATVLEMGAHDANHLLANIYRNEGKQAGTTLVSVFIRGDTLYWVSVGDSRIYLLRGGEMARLTRDHNYALQLEHMVEKGEISREAAESDPKREALISYIGAPYLELMELSPKGFKLESGDMVLLCSDGLTRSLEDAEILSLLRDVEDVEQRVSDLVLRAVSDISVGHDNTTAVLMRYLGAGEATETLDK